MGHQIEKMVKGIAVKRAKKLGMWTGGDFIVGRKNAETEIGIVAVAKANNLPGSAFKRFEAVAYWTQNPKRINSSTSLRYVSQPEARRQIATLKKDVAQELKRFSAGNAEFSELADEVESVLGGE